MDARQPSLLGLLNTIVLYNSSQVGFKAIPVVVQDLHKLSTAS